jgi:molecular chaperone DnaK (HSP70)
MEELLDLEDSASRFVVGIDLGTTNSALAYVDRGAPEPNNRRIGLLDIPQLVASGEIGHRAILPSFLYLPGAYELPPGSTALPWDGQRAYAVGEFAREQGALVPGHLLSSAKSWLCHAGVDRSAAILPWGAASDIPKMSPVEASARYLQHLREAWNQVMARGRAGFRLEEQLLVLTVPASFDEVARELTVQAAQLAGLPRVVLLEEPLAAFYAWLSQNAAGAAPVSSAPAAEQGAFDWQAEMTPGQLILVCDVGGGTTDFTIVAIQRGEQGLRFDRLAVGDHLMLGGDNMDLTIARHIEMRLLGPPGKLESKRWHQLCHQCRKAKETLLAHPDRQQVEVIVVGSGGKLIADTFRETLTLEKVQELIVEGFFPPVGLHEIPQGGRRSGLSEWGLPYVADPAVTRHLAAFWQRHQDLLRQETGRSVLYPEYLLFNGGALTPESVRARIGELVQRWFRPVAGPSWSPRELRNPDPELAVAMGAAYYGLVRLGEGVRVGAGSPRAYYVEVAAAREAPLPAPVGELAGEAPEAPVRTAVCLVPRGVEEGYATQLSRPAFEVLTNQPVAFQLFSSSTRLGDQLGAVAQLPADTISVLPPVRTVLRYGKKGAPQRLPAQLAVRLTEIGTLELWCQSQQSPHRWQLQFDVRSRQEGEAPQTGVLDSGETLDAAVIEQAQEKIRAVFGRGPGAREVAPEGLPKELTALLEMGKEKWPAAVIRKLADTLLECQEGREASPQHEARWFNLLGFCLRPGFGDPLDEWRMKEVWKLYPADLRHPRQAQCRSEWWVFWRRVAGGLGAGHQRHVYQQLSPYLMAAEGRKGKASRKSVKKPGAQELFEIWMALANFEWLPVDAKVQLGRQLLQQIEQGKAKPQELWAFSRLGARLPFYGPLDRVIPSPEAGAWVESLLALTRRATPELAQAVVQLARRTGDRERDLPESALERIASWLQGLPQPERFLELLHNVNAALDLQEQTWIFGESLPSGLIVSG